MNAATETPKTSSNENLVIEIEELEDKIAPGIWQNHNETLVADEGD